MGGSIGTVTTFNRLLCRNCGNVRRWHYLLPPIESWLMAVDRVGRHCRRWSNSQGSTCNHESEGKRKNQEWMLMLVYTVLDVCCTRYMLYSVYAVLGICCTRYMLYSVYAVRGIWCTWCILYVSHAVFGVCCTPCTLYSVSTYDHGMER